MQNVFFSLLEFLEALRQPLGDDGTTSEDGTKQVTILKTPARLRVAIACLLPLQIFLVLSVGVLERI